MKASLLLEGVFYRKVAIKEFGDRNSR
jgi:hypothetical protein